MSKMDELPKSITVLIVDDSPSDRRIYHRFMKHFGWVVSDATTGDEGLAACQNAEYDCIILDYRMPGSNGVSLLPQFREVTNRPILLLTGEPDPLIVSEAFRLGADAYLSKDFISSESLRDKIEILVKSF